MKFVKKLSINLLLVVLFFIVMIVGFVCPIGLIIVGAICHSLWLFLAGTIWLITAIALWITVEDDVEKQIKEEFKI